MTTSERPIDATLEKRLAQYRDMLLIRRFEEAVARLFAEGRIDGTTHLGIGQEAVAVGTCSALAPSDQIVSTHRGHAHLLAKGGESRRLMAELAGRSGGYCRGKGGSQHTAVPAIGHMGSNGITGGGIPLAAGLALAGRMQGRDRIVAGFIGDGACNTGNFHETLNMAALWRLPVIYVCENNLYAMSTPIAEASACSSLTDWASRYTGVRADCVDGNDVEAVELAIGHLAERARRGEGPGFLECLTYRQCGHSKSDPRRYRTREEEAAWAEKDPILVLRRRLLRSNADASNSLEAIGTDVDAEIEASVRWALASPPGRGDDARSGVFASEP